ncbi:MAG: hypothetical protein Q7N95_14930 [Alphaproteobacteria bacterium]|nr:hypothetical protein [Alphaproteobacteria bacterium]
MEILFLIKAGRRYSAIEVHEDERAVGGSPTVLTGTEARDPVHSGALAWLASTD